MNGMQLSFTMAGVTAVLVGTWLVITFNRLVAMRNRVQNAWAQIDVQLNRRHDLVPNLVETARGYMEHEHSVLDAVTAARAQAISASNDLAARATTESMLGGTLGRLVAVAEGYPQLRAAENFKVLQEQLTSTENRIAYARQFYNDEVRKYNTSQATFPGNLVAGMLGFSPKSMFLADEADCSIRLLSKNDESGRGEERG